MNEWGKTHWKVEVREKYDNTNQYLLEAPTTTYVFTEKDFLELASNINAVAEHIFDDEYYYVRGRSVFKKDGEQLDGVIGDCTELNRLYNEIKQLKEENEQLKKENNQLQRYVFHCPQTCTIILAYLKKCGSENVEAVNKAMDKNEYFDEEVDTLRL